jgi:hypothetical protein
VTLALHGLVDGSDGGAGTDVEWGAGEEVENAGVHEVVMRGMMTQEWRRIE